MQHLLSHGLSHVPHRVVRFLCISQFTAMCQPTGLQSKDLHAMSTSGLPAIKQHGQVGVQGAYMLVRDLMLLHDSGRLPVNALFCNSLQAQLIATFSPVSIAAQSGKPVSQSGSQPGSRSASHPVSCTLRYNTGCTSHSAHSNVSVMLQKLRGRTQFTGHQALVQATHASRPGAMGVHSYHPAHGTPGLWKNSCQ
jgi:hypothetical protein